MPPRKKKVNYSPWHPNFRDTLSLPDVKPVKTNFIVNVAAGLVLLAVAVFFFTKQMELSRLEATVTQLSEEIERDSVRNRHLLQLHTEFQNENRKVTEVVNFLSQPFSPVEFIQQLGAVLPERMVFQSVQYEQTGNQRRIVILGRVQAEREVMLEEGFSLRVEDRELRRTRAFGDTLRDNDYFRDNFRDFLISDVTPDRNQGIISFRLTMNVK